MDSRLEICMHCEIIKGVIQVVVPDYLNGDPIHPDALSGKVPGLESSLLDCLG